MVLDKRKLTLRLSAFLGLKHSARAMLASPSGGKGCSIVFTSSQLGLDGKVAVREVVLRADINCRLRKRFRLCNLEGEFRRIGWQRRR